MTTQKIPSWMDDPSEFLAPRPASALSLAQAADKVGAEYGRALGRLRETMTVSYAVPAEFLPLAWFCAGDVVFCASCSTDVEVGRLLLRCPDCGRVAAAPKEWSR